MPNSPASDWQRYWTQVEEHISSVFDDRAFVGNAVRSLVSRDRDAFTKLVKDGLDSVRTRVSNMERAWKGIRPTLTGGFLAASFQYNSTVLGRWLRVRFKEFDSPHYLATPDPFRTNADNSLYSLMEEQYLEQLIEASPREDNLLFNQHLEKPFWVQFGGKPVVPDRGLPGPFYISSQCWDALRRLLSSPKLTLRDLLLSRPSDPEVLFRDEPDIVSLLVELDRALRTVYFGDTGRQWLGGAIRVVRRNRVQTFQQDWAKRLRLWLSTYVYTILQKGPIGADALHQIIVPIRVGAEWIGSFCGAYSTAPDRRIAELERAYYSYCRRLYTIETLALQQLPSAARVTVAENMVRLCCFVPRHGQPAPVEMDQWRIRLRERLKGRHRVDGQGDFMDSDLRRIALRLATSSHAMFELLEALDQRFADEVDSGTGDLRPQTIFLYSQPGLGKESIARLCHYFSARSWKRRLIQRRIRGSFREAWAAGLRWDVKGVVGVRSRYIDIKSRNLKRSWQKNRSFNYDFRNCGTLRAETMAGELFGDSRRPGLLTSASMVCGTVFLDEVNTASREVVNGLLRALEDPYVVEPVGTGARMPLNLLVVFASNVPLEALVDRDGEHRFNPAFADRINVEIRVAPLGERKEDIPLIVNRLIQQHNAEAKPAVTEAKSGLTDAKSALSVRFIELAGLRLLMELPWKRNVRTIKNLVDDLMNVRRRRALGPDAFQTVTAEEIMQCLARGQYL